MYRIRKAHSTDLETLVAFTVEGARDAVGEERDVDAVRRGVHAGLEDPTVATYWVVESTDHQVVGSTSVVTEWSDWHGGYYWWVQSMFIVPEHRGGGLVDLLLDELADAARAGGAPMRVAAVRVTFWGALAMGLTAAVGRVFGVIA